MSDNRVSQPSSEEAQRWTIVCASPSLAHRTKTGWDAPTERARDLARFFRAVAPKSTWELALGSSPDGADRTTIRLPEADSGAIEHALIQHFESQDSEPFPSVQIYCSGMVRCHLSYSGRMINIQDLSTTRSDNISATISAWFAEALRTWPSSTAFAVSAHQESAQHSLTRVTLKNDIRIAAMIRGDASPEDTSKISTIGWLNATPPQAMKHPELLAKEIDWEQDASSGCGFLRVGQTPEDFTFEMAESVHKAVGNPTIEELRKQLADLQR